MPSVFIEMPRSLLTAVCLLMLPAPSIAWAASEQLAEHAARTHLEGLLASQESPRCGICRIVAKSQGDPSGGMFGNQVEAFYAFDFDRDSIRCDRSFQGQHYQFVGSRDYNLIHVGGTGIIQRDPPGKPSLSAAAPFDVRILPVSSFDAFELCLPWERLQTFLRECKCVAARREDSGLVFLSLEHALPPNGTSRIDLWIDSKQFKVVRLVDRAIFDSPTGPVEKLQSETRTEWQEINGSQVPKTLAMKSYNTGRTWHVELAWEQVGGDLDPKLFEPAGFDVKSKTLVVNKMTPGKAIAEEMIAGAWSRKIPPEQDTPAGRKQLILFGLNAAVVLTVLSILVVRSQFFRKLHGG